MRSFNLGKKIKELRLKAGLSQEELAEKAQLGHRTVQRIENGETEPRGDSLKRISEALQIHIEELTAPSTEPVITERLLVEDRLILLLLSCSVFTFFITPWLGIAIPMVIWGLFKDKVQGVDEFGKRLLRSQILWCGLLLVTFFGGMFFSPQSPTITVLAIAALYIFNTIFCVFVTVKSIYYKKIEKELA